MAAAISSATSRARLSPSSTYAIETLEWRRTLPSARARRHVNPGLPVCLRSLLQILWPSRHRLESVSFLLWTGKHRSITRPSVERRQNNITGKLGVRSVEGVTRQPASATRHAATNRLFRSAGSGVGFSDAQNRYARIADDRVAIAIFPQMAACRVVPEHQQVCLGLLDGMLQALW